MVIRTVFVLTLGLSFWTLQDGRKAGGTAEALRFIHQRAMTNTTAWILLMEGRMYLSATHGSLSKGHRCLAETRDGHLSLGLESIPGDRFLSRLLSAWNKVPRVHVGSTPVGTS